MVSLASQAIKNAPGCIRPLVSRILPTIGSILEKVSVFLHRDVGFQFRKLYYSINLKFWPFIFLNASAQVAADWVGCWLIGPFDYDTKSMFAYFGPNDAFFVNFLSVNFNLINFQNAPADVVKAVFETCFNTTIQIILESDDHGEMQVSFF